MCEISSYNFSRFAKQFGYDQLYVGNPCQVLVHKGSLVDSARAWRHFTISSTGASLLLLSKNS